MNLLHVLSTIGFTTALDAGERRDNLMQVPTWWLPGTVQRTQFVSNSPGKSYSRVYVSHAGRLYTLLWFGDPIACHDTLHPGRRCFFVGYVNSANGQIRLALRQALDIPAKMAKACGVGHLDFFDDQSEDCEWDQMFVTSDPVPPQGRDDPAD